MWSCSFLHIPNPACGLVGGKGGCHGGKNHGVLIMGYVSSMTLLG